MQRFFVPKEWIQGDEARLGGEIARQIRQVLRLRAGDRIMLLDGLGYEYTAAILGFGKDEVWAEIVARSAGGGEPLAVVSLYLSLLNKADKFEWALQKCTELGVARIVPTAAERSVVVAPNAVRRERWERKMREAAEQSGRSISPLLSDAVPLGEAITSEGRKAREVKGHIVLMAALGGEASLRSVLQRTADDTRSAALFIGPEGGFSERELQGARQAGVPLVTLGARTLRAETAAVVALSLVMYELGELD